MEQQAAGVPVTDVLQTQTQQVGEMAMDVDGATQAAGAKGKRKAEEDPAGAESKKPKFGTLSAIHHKIGHLSFCMQRLAVPRN